MNTEKAAARWKSVGSEEFWRVLALLNLLTIAWVIWLMWQLTPNSIVHDFVLQMPASRPSSSALAAGRAGGPPGAAPAAEAGTPILSGPPMDTLRIETELKTQTNPAPTGPPPGRAPNNAPK